MKKIPIRKCIGCNARRPKTELLRVLRPPKKETAKEVAVLNVNMHAEGRSAYLCKSTQCFNTAKKRRALQHCFKQKVDENIYNALEKELTNG